VPVGSVNGTTGGAQGVGVAMGKFLGIVVALILTWFFITASMVYNYSFARLLFVSGLERRLPHQIGKVNKNQVPANAVILQTVLASIITIMIFFIIGRGHGDPNTPYFALLAGLTIIWCISTALLFLDVFFAKRADPVRFEQARRVPVGLLYACGGVGFVANIAAVLLIFTGTWYPVGFKKLATWNTWLLVITGVSVGAGVLIYAISERARRGKTDAQLLAEAGTPLAAVGGGGE
jgi:amino acid transporter